MSNCRAAGYLTIFIPPALICVSIATSLTALGLATLLLLFPLLRGLFGDTDGRSPEWTETIATALHHLPFICAFCYGAAVCFTVSCLRRGDMTTGELAWFSGTLWVGFVFGSCVAHELVHRRDAISRNAGRILSGIIGYPFLEHDHSIHHLKNGDAHAAECARICETVWGFSWRRLKGVVPSALEQDMAMAARRGHRLAGGLPVAICGTVLSAASFVWSGGLAGLVVYVVAAVATGWALQAMTYIQHWGLDDQQHAVGGASGWEDRCQLQAWLTLGISFHQSHHQSATVPYYRQTLSDTSPKAPAGYVILFFASLIPGVWRALMIPALERWRVRQGPQPTAGRGLICLR